MNVFHISSDAPFLAELANGVIAQSQMYGIPLPDFIILLPTRRACRELHFEFLNAAGDTPTLLPRMYPIGDLDEQEMILQSPYQAELPPSMPELQRLMLLMRLIDAWYKQSKSISLSCAQSWQLAKSLADLIDQCHFEQINFNSITRIAPQEHALHWQEVTEFLLVLQQQWQAVVYASGNMEQSQRTSELLRRQAKLWADSPPTTPIIAAGSTASMPATAELLRAIAQLPKGAVILPGLDQNLDADSWNAVDDNHPQYFIKRFIESCGLSRAQIKKFGDKHTRGSIRVDLWSEVMRPASSSEKWSNIAISPSHITSMSVIECKSPHQEAMAIAACLREVAESQGKTAALVTPDRNLARRVSAIMRRWNIEIDDSAGETLDKTVLGRFLILLGRAIRENFPPQILFALLKHPKCRPIDRHNLRGAIHKFEKSIRESQDFFYQPNDGILNYAAHARCHELADIVQIFEKLNDYKNQISKSESATDILQKFIMSAEYLCPDIWQDEEGVTASELFTEWLAAAHETPYRDAADIFELLPHLLGLKTVRQKVRSTSPIKILGLMEARLQTADRIILGGLNESVWPPAADADPWMSRPMRQEFGLPSRERRIGQSAHDLVQLACQNADIILTRSLRDGTQPKLPSRFWVRLRTILQSHGLWQNMIMRGKTYIEWAQLPYNPGNAALPPYPTPPVSSRPVQFSVTAIEQWMRDPYGFYAKHILNLRPLKKLDYGFENDIRGSLIHGIFEDFINQYQSDTNQNAGDLAKTIAAKHIRPWMHRADVKNIWWPKLLRVIDWFIQQDNSRRTQIKHSFVELKGQIEFSVLGRQYRLSAKADRIDQNVDGSVDIIDYKTGSSLPSKKQIEAGLSPQLPLESAILSQGGFSEIGAKPVRRVEYWTLNGMGQGGKISEPIEDIDKITKNAIDGLCQLIEDFQSQIQGYASMPHGEKYIRNRDYRHLSRKDEWGDSDMQENE